MSAPVSARGLFRATGKKAKPVAVREACDLGGAVEIRDYKPREKDEFYPTPVEPTRAFLAHELPRLQALGQPAWEHAAGDGAMARELAAAGLDVVCTDLIDRGCGATIRDFYSYVEGDAPSRVLVTNPPFAECNWRDGKGRWIRHALEALAADYLALLLPWGWMGAAGHAALLADHPPARAYLMQWKIDFTGQGAPPMLNGWFIWDGRTAQGETRLLTMGRTDDWRAADLFSTETS